MWTDESHFRERQEKRSYVRRPKGKAAEEKYCDTTVRHSPSLSFWGAFRVRGQFHKLLEYHGRLNGPRYQSDVLKPFLATLPKKSHFQKKLKLLQVFACLPSHHLAFSSQDNAPCHSSKSTKAYLAKHFKGQLLDFPASSPDLNIIEHIWSQMKRRMSGTFPLESAFHLAGAIFKKSELKVQVEHQWEHCVETYGKSLAHSMPARLAAVIVAKGGPTRY